MYETLLVNNTDLASLCDCIQSIDGLYSIGATRGDNLVFPGVDGETWVDKPFATGMLELGLQLKGETTAEFNTRLRTLRTLLAPGQQVTLARRTSYTGGNETHVSAGEYSDGLRPTLRFARFGAVTLSIKVLDGIWYAETDTSASVASGGSMSVLGETRTHRMVIGMAAGASITNTTNGHWVSNSLTSGGTVWLDVETMVATQDGNDVSYALNWNKRFPMRLTPGTNSFTGSAFSVDYYPAYL